MSAITGSQVEGIDLDDDDDDGPWWKDREVFIPIFSGVAFLAGLICEWSGADTAALVLFWVGLLLGASTFVPGALRKLLTRGKLGIGLLMTISATGAVILGYVEEAAALAFLYSIAEALEDKAMDRARSGLRALLKLVPETASIRRDGVTIEIQVSELQIGDLLVVRPGERVATDGIVREGHSSLDTSAITGESIPVEVDPGDDVSAGSINAAGALTIEATAAGADNSLTTIVELVEKARAEKGERARLADRIARPLVPGVLILAVLVAVIGSLLGDPELWITRALDVLVAASPCALAIAVPLTVVAGVGSASKFGVIIKSGAAFERFGGIRHLAVDKTGTLTRNQPTVTRVITTNGATREDVLAWAAALEQHSTHPLAAAITAAAPEAAAAEAVTETAGHGITGHIDGATITVGSPRWLSAGPLEDDVETLESEGMTVVIVHQDGAVRGAIGVRDELRPEVPEVIRTLGQRGITVTMLTGDNARTARAISAQAGIQDVRAELRPEDKASAVSELARIRSTAMIGDGINDAPALAAADVGIAMGTGTDVAMESAGITLLKGDLRGVAKAITLSRAVMRNIRQNLFFAFIYNAVGIPLAAGLLYPVFG
ncbi:MAG: cadmium-translocating P-type ATPase, partial [Cryobacterium sp.]|nr:cadmium-translocating P-type ATPase [Cryobacterium sp.]